MLRLTKPADLPDRAWGTEVQKIVNAGQRENPVIDFALMKAHIIAGAEMAHYPYPQYNGYWDGDEWRLICMPKRFRAKSGIAWEPGDWTIIRRQGDGESAYSLRLNCMVQYKAFDSVAMVQVRKPGQPGDAKDKTHHLDDLPPAPPKAALQRRYDMLNYRMMALGEGDLLLTAYLDECLDFSQALVRFAAAGIDRPIGSYAPELLAIIVKYEDLLARSAEPAQGAHDGFGNR